MNMASVGWTAIRRIVVSLSSIGVASVAFLLPTWTVVHAANPCVVLSAAGEIQQFSSYSEFVMLSDAEGSSLSAWNRSIRTAPRTSVYNVTGHRPTNETIIKADRVVFNQGGTLEFQNLDAEFWAIVARTLEFNFRPRSENTSSAPDRFEQVHIVRHANHAFPTLAQASSGANGKSYSGGASGHARAPKGEPGATGDPGLHGDPGKAGSTKELPCLVLIASEIVFNGLGSEEPLADRIVFDLKGLPGGDGGQGGNGGRGGEGQAGGNASFNLLTLSCNKIAQHGGNGGRGGDAGPGGPGGKGGDGGDLLFIGNTEAGSELLSAAVYNTPGNAGRGGEPGRGGDGGLGGAPGERGARPCGSEQDRGRTGKSGCSKPPEGHLETHECRHVTSGHSGPEGAQGRILIVGLEDPQQGRLFDFLSPE